MAVIDRFLAAATIAVVGCGADTGSGAAKNPARMTSDEVKKSIQDENERVQERINALEKKYGKDHPIVKEERGNLGATESKGK